MEYHQPYQKWCSNNKTKTLFNKNKTQLFCLLTWILPNVFFLNNYRANVGQSVCKGLFFIYPYRKQYMSKVSERMMRTPPSTQEMTTTASRAAVNTHIKTFRCLRVHTWLLLLHCLVLCYSQSLQLKPAYPNAHLRDKTQRLNTRFVEYQLSLALNPHGGATYTSTCPKHTVIHSHPTPAHAKHTL